MKYLKNVKTNNDMIDFIKSLGYRVFVMPGANGNIEDSIYCHYSDGVNIAYCQWGASGFRVCTVHKPCTGAGTGYAISEGITPIALQVALKVTVPAWERGNIPPIRKYKDIEEFLNYDSWNKRYIEA